MTEQTTEQKPAEQETSPLVEKLLKEKKNWQMKAEQEAKEKADLASQLKAKEEAELQAQQKYKELYEVKNKEVTSLNEKISLIEKEKIDGEKRAILRKEFEKNGIKQERVDFVLSTVDLSQLKYDPDHKIVLGAEDQVKLIKDTLPEVFSGPNVQANHTAPNTTTAKIDMDAYKKMSLTDQKNPEIIKKLYASYGVEVR